MCVRMQTRTHTHANNNTNTCTHTCITACINVFMCLHTCMRVTTMINSTGELVPTISNTAVGAILKFAVGQPGLVQRWIGQCQHFLSFGIFFLALEQQGVFHAPPVGLIQRIDQAERRCASRVDTGAVSGESVPPGKDRGLSVSCWISLGGGFVGMSCLGVCFQLQEREPARRRRVASARVSSRMTRSAT